MAVLTLGLLLIAARAISALDHQDFSNTTSNDAFNTWIESANASTVRDITLPNIHTEEYPAKGSEVKYKAWLYLTPNNTEGGTIDAGLHPDEEYIYENGTLKSDESWVICPQLSRFVNPGLPIDEPINTDCSNVFPEECLEWIKETSKKGNMCRGTESWMNSPCNDALGGESDTSAFDPYRPFRAIGLRNLTLSTSATEDDQPVEKRYDYFVDSVYMITLGFARPETGEGDENDLEPIRLDSDAPTVPDMFICMRADQFKEGSRTLQDIEDASVGLAVPHGWMVMVSAGAVVMITLGMF